MKSGPDMRSQCAWCATWRPDPRAPDGRCIYKKEASNVSRPGTNQKIRLLHGLLRQGVRLQLAPQARRLARVAHVTAVRASSAVRVGTYLSLSRVCLVSLSANPCGMATSPAS